jgi:cytochrome c peroxidase
MLRSSFPVAVTALLWGTVACSQEEAPPPPAAPPAEAVPAPAPDLDASAVRARATRIFSALPAEAASESNPVTEEKIALGRALYYDTRLSKNQEISCNSCHQLNRFGVDGEPTSPGHKGQRGDRNSPTVLNAAFHIAQFWDGRAADVEEQAKGPVLNPVEMAMPSEEAVVAVLKSIPGYTPLFEAAFPESEDPITYDNMARAIGAFERRIVTTDQLDAFLAGDDGALPETALAGLDAFMNAGCTTCHVGPAVGGGLYQKLGLVKPYETDDPGRMAVTDNESDRGVFKVPSLRNVAVTGPWFHDGSVTSLQEAIRLMGEHQLGRSLDAEQVDAIEAFLTSLTGTLDEQYVAQPELPESGPDTPAPDPS